jgi:hypothetical protein
MSTSLVIEHPAPIDAAEIELGLPDLRWTEPPPWQLADGTWHIYRDRISTRTTKIVREAPRVTLTIAAGACDEDRRLALALAHRLALPGARIDADVFGEVPLYELDACLDEAWEASQLESAARIALHLAREQGSIEMPGPTRNLRVGPRVIAELEAVPESDRGERLVAIMRRVFWPDPRYESAGLFQSKSATGEVRLLAMLLPERACVLPFSHDLALEDEAGAFLVPRAALDALPVAIEHLDDGNTLVEHIPAAAWAAVCRAARATLPV